MGRGSSKGATADALAYVILDEKIPIHALAHDIARITGYELTIDSKLSDVSDKLSHELEVVFRETVGRDGSAAGRGNGLVAGLVDREQRDEAGNLEDVADRRSQPAERQQAAFASARRAGTRRHATAGVRVRSLDGRRTSRAARS